MALRVKGDILWGILVAAIAAVCSLDQASTGIVAAPNFSTFLARSDVATKSAQQHGISRSSRDAHGRRLRILLTDFFDTIGTTVAVGEQAGFVGPDARSPAASHPRSRRCRGGRRLVRCKLDHEYIESASVAEGGAPASCRSSWPCSSRSRRSSRDHPDDRAVFNVGMTPLRRVRRLRLQGPSRPLQRLPVTAGALIVVAS